jgi:hypothetical protein
MLQMFNHVKQCHAVPHGRNLHRAMLKVGMSPHSVSFQCFITDNSQLHIRTVHIYRDPCCFHLGDDVYNLRLH